VSGPLDLTANAYHAAIDAASSLGDLAFCGRVYAELAELPLPGQRRRRYRALARRYDEPAAPRPPAPGLSKYSRRPDADVYPDVWFQDLVEWELDGDPTAVLARLLAWLPERSAMARHAVRALLICNAPGFSLADPAHAAELAVELGRVSYYHVLRPLERLYEHPAPEVRAAVMRGAAQVWAPRSFDLVRKGLADPSAVVTEEALRAIREMRFRDGLESQIRIFRESTDERTRMAALESIARIEGTSEVALVLLEAARQESGAIRQAAEAHLEKLSGEEAATVIRQARDLEVGDRYEVLDRILRAVGGGR